MFETPVMNVQACSACGDINCRNGQRYCVKCHNSYMREWRKTHKLTGLSRVKDLARHKAGIYLRRGKIALGVCEVCDKPAQMHHDDYSRPLQVRWLCLEHHRELHKQIKKEQGQ